MCAVRTFKYLRRKILYALGINDKKIEPTVGFYLFSIKVFSSSNVTFFSFIRLTKLSTRALSISSMILSCFFIYRFLPAILNLLILCHFFHSFIGYYFKYFHKFIIYVSLLVISYIIRKGRMLYETNKNTHKYHP